MATVYPPFMRAKKMIILTLLCHRLDRDVYSRAAPHSRSANPGHPDHLRRQVDHTKLTTPTHGDMWTAIQGYLAHGKHPPPLAPSLGGPRGVGVFLWVR